MRQECHKRRLRAGMGEIKAGRKNVVIIIRRPKKPFTKSFIEAMYVSKYGYVHLKKKETGKAAIVCLKSEIWKRTVIMKYNTSRLTNKWCYWRIQLVFCCIAALCLPVYLFQQWHRSFLLCKVYMTYYCETLNEEASSSMVHLKNLVFPFKGPKLYPI